MRAAATPRASSRPRASDRRLSFQKEAGSPVAAKSSNAAMLRRQASFGAGSGKYDEKGYAKEESPEERVIVGGCYFIPDRALVWSPVVVEDIEEDNEEEDNNNGNDGDGDGGDADAGADAEKKADDDAPPKEQRGWALVRPVNAGTTTPTSANEPRRINLKEMLPPSPLNPPGHVDDVTSLHYIHEAAILENLKLRSKQDPPIPYTYMCNVLIAVNPLRRDLAFHSSDT